jgi:hypothetical protein
VVRANAAVLGKVPTQALHAHSISPPLGSCAQMQRRTCDWFGGQASLSFCRFIVLGMPGDAFCWCFPELLSPGRSVAGGLLVWPDWNYCDTNVEKRYADCQQAAVLSNSQPRTAPRRSLGSLDMRKVKPAEVPAACVGHGTKSCSAAPSAP